MVMELALAAVIPIAAAILGAAIAEAARRTAEMSES